MRHKDGLCLHGRIENTTERIHMKTSQISPNVTVLHCSVRMDQEQCIIYVSVLNKDIDLATAL